MAGIYIHIPFCEKKCIYCDFFSITDLDYAEPFLKALYKEIDLIADTINFPEVNTVYFGGGTPSLLLPDFISAILEKIYKKFRINQFPEVTIEANPNSLKKESLLHYHKNGINRISIGIQSFIPDELKLLQRLHTSAEAVQSFYLARECGFDNISIDLIYSIPFSSLDKWKFNLDKALELNPEHISAYSLIYEEETELFRKLEEREYSAITEEIEAEMYLYAIKFLKMNGFIHYEVSNYAKPGKESRHNSSYWNYEQYIGLGPSAHSFLNNYRSWNYKSVEKYISELNNNKLPVESGEFIDNEILLKEKMFLGLRSAGLNLQEIISKYKPDFYKKYEKEIKLLSDKKYIKIENGNLSLTDEGFLLCDEICKMFM
jgi:oxygen-independent coproporphyrinogen III oxidase